MSERTGSRPAIVFGVDYSPANERALETAIQTAQDWDAHLSMVHALRPLGAPGLDVSRPPVNRRRNESADVTATEPSDLARQWLERATGAGVDADLVNRPGPAAQALLDEADRLDARAIVVGSHGKSGLEKATLGSVADAVVRKSPVPVIVVPGGPESR